MTILMMTILIMMILPKQTLLTPKEIIFKIENMLQQKSFKQFFEIINKYSHIQKLDIIKFAIINNLNEIKNLFYPYWREDDGLIYISYLSATEKTSYSSNKKKGIDDFSKDIICSDRTLKKWKVMESISKMMKEHYYNEINKRINIHTS